MKQILFLIYLEGHPNQANKQERNFFQHKDSKRLWNDIYERFNFSDHIFKNLPKRIESESDCQKMLQIIDDEISRKINSDTEIKIIISGDHDEKNDHAALKLREEFALAIQKYFKNFYCKIILKPQSNFKLENFMAQLINQKINKKILKQEFNTIAPTLRQLTKLLKLKNDHQIVEQIVNNIKQSKHLICKAICAASYN